MEMEMINKVNQVDQINEKKTENEAEQLDEVSVILQPGSKIRPEVDGNDVKRIAERLYGISSKYIGELPSYDDRNFLIHADR